MRKQHLQHGLLALALAAAASTAHAETQVVLGGLLTTGGDTLAAGTYSDGTDWRIRGGGFLHVFAGVEYRQPTSPVSVQATIGYHIDDTSASNGSITFSRFPAELLLLWQPQEWFRAGVGLRKSLGTHLSSSGVASMSVGSTDLNSQLGMGCKVSTSSTRTSAWCCAGCKKSTTSMAWTSTATTSAPA